jgi:hypothetical protein
MWTAVVSTVVGMLARFALLFGAWRAGRVSAETAMAKKGVAYAQRANQIDAETARLDDVELRRELQPTKGK